MDFFQQGIPLGRWFGIRVIIHWLFLLYAANAIFSAPPEARMGEALFMGLLFGTVLMHEFGHALACKGVGGVAEHIILWPLGGIAFVQPPNEVKAWLITTVCGPLVNAVLWPAFWLMLHYGMPVLARYVSPESQAFEMVGTVCYLMAYINKLLLLFNLIPAYPMDGGRLLQELLWLFLDFRRSLHIAGMVGTVAGGCFVVIGLGLADISIPALDFSLGEKGQQEWMLIAIGLMCMMQSFGIYRRSQAMAGWRKN